MNSEPTTEVRVTALVGRVISETTGRDLELSPDTQLLEEGLLDSLLILQIFAALQEELEVELDGSDITEETFASTAAIAALVKARS